MVHHSCWLKVPSLEPVMQEGYQNKNNTTRSTKNITIPKALQTGEQTPPPKSSLTTLLDGKFPDLRVANYKVSHAEAIRKITSNGYRLQVMTSKGTHGNVFTLTRFEQTYYMPLILNFLVNMDLKVTRNIQGPAIKFAKETRQSFRPLHNVLLSYTRAFLLKLGWHAVPCSPVLSLNLSKFLGTGSVVE